MSTHSKFFILILLIFNFIFVENIYAEKWGYIWDIRGINNKKLGYLVTNIGERSGTEIITSGNINDSNIHNLSYLSSIASSQWGRKVRINENTPHFMTSMILHNDKICDKWIIALDGKRVGFTLNEEDDDFTISPIRLVFDFTTLIHYINTHDRKTFYFFLLDKNDQKLFKVSYNSSRSRYFFYRGLKSGPVFCADIGNNGLIKQLDFSMSRIRSLKNYKIHIITHKGQNIGKTRLNASLYPEKFDNILNIKQETGYDAACPNTNKIFQRSGRDLYVQYRKCFHEDITSDIKEIALNKIQTAIRKSRDGKFFIKFDAQLNKKEIMNFLSYRRQPDDIIVYNKRGYYQFTRKFSVTDENIYNLLEQKYYVFRQNINYSMSYNNRRINVDFTGIGPDSRFNHYSMIGKFCSDK
ncbi:hypothetical protein GMMP15_1130004 [Candidatus Magnetomoraceae bacterium gMMP-15]